jgi:hypothetical protein
LARRPSAIAIRPICVLALLSGFVALSGRTNNASASAAVSGDQNSDATRHSPPGIEAPKQAPASRYVLVNRETIEKRLDSAPRNNDAREPALEFMFEQSGCKDVSLFEQPVTHEKFPNLICRVPGATNSTIIVGAHFDKVARGGGVVDNWSGASLLPSLFQSLQDRTRKHTFVFVGFTAEERGLVGSAYYVAHMSDAEIGRTRAMVNLDTLALGPTEVWLTHSDRKLAGAFFAMAASMKLPVSVANADRVGDDDSHSFIRRKVPTLMVHSLTNQTLHILHSDRDNLSAVKFNDYYDTYRLLTAFLAWIDVTLD